MKISAQWNRSILCVAQQKPAHFFCLFISSQHSFPLYKHWHDQEIELQMGIFKKKQSGPSMLGSPQTDKIISPHFSFVDCFQQLPLNLMDRVKALYLGILLPWGQNLPPIIYTGSSFTLCQERANWATLDSWTFNSYRGDTISSTQLLKVEEPMHVGILLKSVYERMHVLYMQGI